MSHVVVLWARAFVITVAVESLVATPLLADPDDRAKGVGRGRRLGIVLFAQVMSHPAVWFIFPSLGLPYAASLTLSEAWAVGSEIVFYRLVFPDLGWPRAAAAGALANAASFGAGLLLRFLA